jgi:hypothetical protein
MSENTRATRPVGNARLLKDGSIVAESMLSPTSFVVRAEVWIPPRRVIPVVFLPGIMGSNLKVKPGSEGTVRKRMGLPGNSEIPIPWRPPNGKVEGAWEVRKWGNIGPNARQALLSDDTTMVDDTGFLAAQVDGMPLSNLTSMNDEEAYFRGWGTVYWSSYGEFLLYLERELRNLQDPRLWLNPKLPIAALDDPMMYAAAEWWPLLHAGDPKQSSAPATFKVTREDLKKLAHCWFPVYACGYNWLKSCADSGQHVLDTVEKILEVYTSLKSVKGKPLFTCEKVILVTHSMGGLVARWAAKNDTKNRILGVLHSVQPATGAPLTYRRTAAGTETGGILQIPQNLFAKIAGKTQAETTPVTCNSAGALELLPTKQYPKGWLQLERQNAADGSVRTLATLPKDDPYQEIYREKKAWWRMVDPELLDPAGRYSKVGKSPWDVGFLRTLMKAEMFHDNLGDYYHPNTYVSYADDPAHLSFGTIHWRVSTGFGPLGQQVEDDEILSSRLRKDPWEEGLSGRRPLAVFRPTGARSMGNNQPLLTEAVTLIAEIQPQDAPGDGTVPWQSGEAPRKASPRERTFALRDYDHQGAYGHENPRRFTLWAIAKLISETT